MRSGASSIGSFRMARLWRNRRDKGVTASDIAMMLGVSRATAYRYLADGASQLA